MDSTEKQQKQEELNDAFSESQNEINAENTWEEGVSEIEKHLEEANQKIEEMQDKYLRLSAEFDNYRKRTMKEKAELIMNGGEKIISNILPVLDDLERALETMNAAQGVEAMKEGVELIYNKFIGILNQNGLEKIETQGKEFSTDYHEAVAMVPASSENLKGQILDCIQTGYTLNGRVIRHSKVVVGE